MGVDWVALLGPGGLVVLIVVLDRIMRARQAQRSASLEVTIDHWQEILKERETQVRTQRKQLNDIWMLVDYWRTRAATAEYACKMNGIQLPDHAPEPKLRP